MRVCMEKAVFEYLFEIDVECVTGESFFIHPILSIAAILSIRPFDPFPSQAPSQ